MAAMCGAFLLHLAAGTVFQRAQDSNRELALQLFWQCHYWQDEQNPAFDLALGRRLRARTHASTHFEIQCAPM